MPPRTVVQGDTSLFFLLRLEHKLITLNAFYMHVNSKRVLNRMLTVLPLAGFPRMKALVVSNYLLKKLYQQYVAAMLTQKKWSKLVLDHHVTK